MVSESKLCVSSGWIVTGDSPFFLGTLVVTVLVAVFGPGRPPLPRLLPSYWPLALDGPMALELMPVARFHPLVVLVLFVPTFLPKLLI